MNINKQLVLLIASFVLVVTTLVGCGESDIDGQKERELEDARIAARNQPVLGAGSAINGEAENQESGVGVEADLLDLSQYTLMFGDEFHGTELDSTKWNTALPWGSDLVINSELQYYVDIANKPDFGYSPFSFDGETLTITAIETPENLRASANEQGWLSGVLTTAGKLEVTYGYIETRVDLPPGRGLWPAFWMLSSEFIDLKPQLFVMEYNGGRANSVFHNYNYQDEDNNLRSPGQWEVVEEGLSEGFHTVGVAWSPEELLFYVDGKPRYKITGENVSRQSMYLILNLAVGGVWTGAPDATTRIPASYVIDYVRVYEKN
ncbi:MAG: glycoside hydrolase family 16 protein [Granulosicoccus sp.]